MDWPPAIVVHGFDHACMALRPGRPAGLLSGPGAGVHGGVGWWRAMIGAARAEVAAPGGPDILDCGDAPGAAMAALRAGQAALVLDPRCPAFAAVRSAAVGRAIVLDGRPAALDLAMLDPRRAADEIIAAWLAGDDSAPRFG